MYVDVIMYMCISLLKLSFGLLVVASFLNLQPDQVEHRALPRAHHDQHDQWNQRLNPNTTYPHGHRVITVTFKPDKPLRACLMVF